MKNDSLLRRALNNWPIMLLSVGIAVLLFFFNDVARLEERFVTVPLELLLDEGYTPGELYTNRVRVRLRGEAEEIFSVQEEDVEAFADFTEHANEGVYREPIETRLSGTAVEIEPLEITVEPALVTVTLEEKFTTELEVVPTLEGFPPQGYELAQFWITPSAVRVSGPRSHVADLSIVRTEPIDLAGRNADFTMRVPLTIDDPLVNLQSTEVVEFHGVVEESVVLSTFEPVPVILLDLDPDLRPAEPLPDGSIRVQGNQVLLESIPAEQVRLTVDASGITEPGVYELAARPDLPSGLLVLRFSPSVVRVEIEEAQ